MSILNVNQIQPVGGGNTITVSASDVNFSGNISVSSSFVGTATTASLATSAQGLTGTPDITVNNIQSGVVTATTFIGDGSGLTGVTASGSGIYIKDGGSTVGVAATVDFGTNLNVSPASAGIVTVTVGDTDFAIVDKIVHTGDTNTAIRFPAVDTITAETDGSERLRIDSTGRALLGSQRTYGGGTYYDDLTINNSNTASGAAGGVGIDLVSGNASWGGYIFSDSDNHARGYIKYDHGDDEMVFGTSGSNRVIITSDGHTLFSGLTSNVDTRNAAGISLSSPGGITFKRTSSTGSRNWRLRPDDLSAWGSLEFSVAPTDGSSDIPDAAGDVVLELKSNKDVKIHDGNLIIGTSGHGIDFSATSDAGGMTSELLDDYEEGTWTPTVTSSGYTQEGSNQFGIYTKIGRLVHISGQFSFSAINTSSDSSAMFSGLPFTVKSGGHQVGVARETETTGAIFVMQVNQNSSTLGMNSMDSISDNSNRSIVAGKNYNFSVSYEV